MIEKNREKKLLNDLRKELKLKYPPYHWKHVQVWSNYWNLADCLGMKTHEGGEGLSIRI